MKAIRHLTEAEQEEAALRRIIEAVKEEIDLPGAEQALAFLDRLVPKPETRTDLEMAREHLKNWDARLAQAEREVERLRKHRAACASNIINMERRQGLRSPLFGTPREENT